MSKRNDIDLLGDIQDSIGTIFGYVEGMSYNTFMSDKKTQDAVVRNLEIIGEASKAVSEEVKNKYSEVSWSDLAKMRDKLIHHYSGVNFDIVWDVIEEHLPQELKNIEQIISSEKL